MRRHPQMPQPPLRERGTTIILVLVIILFMVTLAVSFLRGMGIQRDLAEGLRRDALLEHTIFAGTWDATRELERNYTQERAGGIPTTLNGHWATAFAPTGAPGEEIAEELWNWDSALLSSVTDDYRVHHTDGVWKVFQYLDERYRRVDLLGDARFVARYAIATMDLTGRIPVNRAIQTEIDNGEVVPLYYGHKPAWRANALTPSSPNIAATGLLNPDEPNMTTLEFTAYYMSNGIGFYEGYGISTYQTRDTTTSTPLSDSDIAAGWLSKGTASRRMSQRYNYPGDWPENHSYDLFNWLLIRQIASQSGGAAFAAALTPKYPYAGIPNAPSWNAVASLHTPFGQGDQLISSGTDDEGRLHKSHAQQIEYNKFQWMININTAPPAVIRGMLAAADATLELENNHGWDHKSFLFWFDKDPDDVNARAQAALDGHSNPDDWTHLVRIHRTNENSTDSGSPGLTWLTNTIIAGRPYTASDWKTSLKNEVGDSGSGIVSRLLDGVYGMKLVRRQSRFYRVALRAQIWDRHKHEAIQQKTIDFVLHLDPDDNEKIGDSYIMFYVDRGWIR